MVPVTSLLVYSGLRYTNNCAQLAAPLSPLPRLTCQP